MILFDRMGNRRAFTLLEVMVSVAVLALAVVPMLLTREYCYDSATETKILCLQQELAKRQLSYIALNVIRGEGAGDFEDYPDFTYEYEVTIYDFQAGLEEDEENDDGAFNTTAPGDAVYVDNDLDNVGSHMARHIILRVYAPDQDDGQEAEYVIDTYVPLLLTREQYNKMQDDKNNE